MGFASNFVIVFVCIHYLQFETCESNPGAKHTSLVANVHSSKLQRLKPEYHLQKSQIPCRGNKKLCLLQKQVQQHIKKQNNKEKKRDKNDKRCCKKKDKICKRKLRKKCHLKTKCLIKQSRLCRKKYSRCSRRKATNRRPGNCRPPVKPSINQGRNIYNKPAPSPATTTKPVALKKKETDECNHSNECEDGLCCARHQHVKRCKPLIKKGQVCTRDFNNPQKRSPEMFERCPCESGLSCAASTLSRHYTCQIVT